MAIISFYKCIMLSLVFCLQFEWVEHYLGKDWISRTILTRDKTVVGGHILIDDNVKIKGMEHDNF
jgi:hypothetical protein